MGREEDRAPASRVDRPVLPALARPEDGLGVGVGVSFDTPFVCAEACLQSPVPSGMRALATTSCGMA